MKSGQTSLREVGQGHAFAESRKTAASDGTNPLGQSAAPVFVLGCPRSGTTLLYHMLLSAGGFAVYRTESSVFNVLRPYFGNFANPSNRKRLIDAWIQSRLFQVSGLDECQIRAKLMRECRSAGDFLRIVMEEISRRQGVSRWADCTPEHLLYIPEIKRAFPNALVIHMIRDGRDVALSLEKQHWIRPLFSRTGSALLAAGFYWEWIVRKGRELGNDIAPNYMEVRFRELVLSPPEALRKISRFIGQPLDYDQIRRTAIGSVQKPNTSFEPAAGAAGFAPVGRWKTAFPQAELSKFEAVAGRTLTELGYSLSTETGRKTALLTTTRSVYRAVFGTRLWLKKHTGLRHMVKPDLSWL